MPSRISISFISIENEPVKSEEKKSVNWLNGAGATNITMPAMIMKLSNINGTDNRIAMAVLPGAFNFCQPSAINPETFSGFVFNIPMMIWITIPPSSHLMMIN
ncbi:MAG: hypothetical protein WBZ29_14680 [Methanocella sp.]